MENTVGDHMDHEATDRYSGNPYSDPATVCEGECEGLGIIPIMMFPRDAYGEILPAKEGECRPVSEERDRNYRALWFIVHNSAHTLRNRIRMAWKYKDFSMLWWEPVCTGTHFVECIDCNGTGKKIVY